MNVINLLLKMLWEKKKAACARKGYMLHIVSTDMSVCNVLFSRMLHFPERLRISDSLGDLVSAERRSVGRVNISK